jgi:hypothetical protein
MDIDKTLRELHQEKKRLDGTIAALEARVKVMTSLQRHRRGRKGMSPEQRLEVSRRMQKYWEARKTSADSLNAEHKSAAATATGGSPSASS